MSGGMGNQDVYKRQVEEQRTQIGVLKALGYSEGRIMGKYLYYAGSAGVIGSVIGFVIGSTVFPTVIWSAYRIMYNLGDYTLYLDWRLAAVSLAAAMLCSMGAVSYTHLDVYKRQFLVCVFLANTTGTLKYWAVMQAMPMPEASIVRILFTPASEKRR